MAGSEAGGVALFEAVPQRDALGEPLPPLLSVVCAVSEGGGVDAVGAVEKDATGVAEVHMETEGVAHSDAAAFVGEVAAESEGKAVPLALAVPPTRDAEAGVVALATLLTVAEVYCESVPVAHAVAHPLPLSVALPDAEGFPLLGEAGALTVARPDMVGNNEEEARAEYASEPLPAALHDAGRVGVTLPELHAKALPLGVALPVPDAAATEGLPLEDGEAHWLCLALQLVDVVDEREGKPEAVTQTEVNPDTLAVRQREGEGVPLPEGDSDAVSEERPEGVPLAEGHGEAEAQLLAETLWEPKRLAEGLVERVAVTDELPEKEKGVEPLRLADALTLPVPHPLPLRDSVALAEALPDALL